MTVDQTHIKRDFELSELNASQVLDMGLDQWEEIDGIFIDETEPEITQDVDGVRYVKAWARVDPVA